ncbi:MAG: response regulator [Clostridia bacterium]|nr:response regulator [Clostridia bacterium]MBR3273758.1 response regulator [Clostridia bacterium]
MMKVFLVDDEIAIRENLRNSFPWEENGFQLVGEAPDGEMALPMIRDLNPDILLTDIRMPFMDGMALCAEVKRVLPWIGVVILSGYDDFSYARQAISLGVKEYLLKPITADELGEALRRVAGQIAEERRAQSLRREAASGNPFLREKLLASLFTEEGDRFEDGQLMRQMRAMGVNLAAGCYVVIDIAFPLKDEARARAREALSALAEATGGSVFTCGMPHGARALVLGDNERDAEERAYSFAASAAHLPQLEHCESLMLSIGETVTDYFDIRRSMQSARHVRHAAAGRGGGRRIIGVGELDDETTSLNSLELSPLYERLQYAPVEELDAILADYADLLGSGVEGRELALGYLRIAAVIAAQRIVTDAGADPQRVLDEGLIAEALRAEGLEAVRALLEQAMACRDASGRGLGQTPVGRARSFLSKRYSDPNLMLQDVAGEVGMSQSHFSTVFAQETGLTFTQYLTALRIGKAKELLTATAMRSSEIAFAVGYNDAHYFSYMFKKQTGVTPSEYRKENGNQRG